MAFFSPLRFFSLTGILLALLLLSTCSKPKISVWNLFPASTIAVLENAPIRELENQPLVITPIGQFLPPDSAIMVCTVAWIAIEKNRKEELFIISETASVMNRIKARYGKEIKQRNLNGYDFYELGTKDQRICVLSIGDLLAISTNPLTIEAVIRTVSQQLPIISLAQLKKLPNLKHDQGNLYVDWTAIPLPWPLGSQSTMDVQQTDSTLMMDGFTLTDSVSSSWQLLKTMEMQTPVNLSLQDIVPIGTHEFLHLGMSDAVAWNSVRLDQLRAQKRSVFDSLQAILRSTGFSGDRFFEAIDHEVGFVTDDHGLVITCKLKEITKATHELRKIRVGADEESNLNFSEHGRLIHFLFWPFAPAFEELHYAVDGDILFLANTQSALQHVLEKIMLDQTWGKSLLWQKFHSAMLKEANVSFFFADPVQHSVLQDFTASVPTKGYAQFSNVDRSFYTNVLLQFRRQPKKNSASSVTSGQMGFASIIQSRPYPVINHSTGQEEVIFIDSVGRLTLVAQNKTLWSIPVGRPESAVFQIDFFRNRKLQYVLVAGQKLQIIDRLGRQLNGYPISLPKGTISSLTIVDYNQTRDYRFLINYMDGNILLIDRKGKFLEGWNPKKFGEEIRDIRFQRLKGKDYFLALGRKSLLLTNRKGEPVPGFPVAGPEELAPRVVTDARTGLFLVLGAGGGLRWIDVNGVIRKEVVVPKNVQQTTFHLLSSGDQAYVLRVDQSKLALLDLNGNRVFEVENPASLAIRPQVVLLKGKPYLFVYDIEQKLVHGYSPEGAALLGLPKEASVEPAIVLSPDQALHVFTVFRSQLSATIIR